jgi:adenylate cyclase
VKIPRQLPSLFFYGSSTAAILIAAACFYLAFTWIGKPFAGVLVYKFPQVGSFKSPDWPCTSAGINVMDRVNSIDGKKIHRGQEVVHLAETKSVGKPVVCNVTSKGHSRKVTLPVRLFSLGDFILIFIVPFIGGLIFYTLGFVVYLLKPNTHASWVFFFSSLLIGFYTISGFEIQSTYSFVYLHYFVTPFMPASLFHIGSVFPEKKQILNRYPWLEYLIYGPALFLAIGYQLYLLTFFLESPPNWVPHISQLSSLNRIFTLSSVAGLVLLIIHSLLKASTVIARQRARLILIGITIAFLAPALIMLAVIFFKIDFPFNFLVFFTTFFPASIAYSIIRHNLFDADALIKQALGYTIITIILIGVYALVSLGLNFFLGQYRVAQSRAFPVFFTLAFILIFNPLRNRIQELVDRLFFRKEYNAKEIIDRLGSAMTSLMDLPQILRQLVTPFSQDMFIDNSAVLLLNHSGTAYQVRHSQGEKRLEMEGITFHKAEPLPQLIEKEKKEITKYDILEDPKYKEICLDCAQNFSTLHASLIIPMVLHGEVIGFLSLGDKKSGKFYNREDIDLLRTLAGQGAVAIENARLAKQMKNEEAVRANLARYLSPQVVDQIIKNDMEVNLVGDRKKVTILFSDIRNFTSISESMNPDQLVRFLNEYFTEMARVIFDNHGSLDKYIGDAIIAVFGSLIPLDNPDEAAVKTSVEMMREMVRLNEKWENQYGFNMEMGIGINTGEVFLGNIGSPDRMEFTVIGDSVNTASRLSGLAKGRQILVTKATRDRLGSEFKINQLPLTRVKGKVEELDVYEIVY